ncbi:hypothetical protein J6P92_04340 [bacterium]|nr:hypothetical protein [bacterium]
MAIIRRLNCFDTHRIKKMIAYLGNNEKFSQDIMTEAFTLFHSVLPLKCKFLPETYILLENEEILGLITVVSTPGNPYKINITRLIFRQNLYDTGKQLVEFVIAKYGAKGAQSFRVNVDQSHDDLLNLFINGCGFRQCSYENLWKLDNYIPETATKAKFRCCQNSDAEQIAHLYNNELKNLYKFSLERKKSEYTEPFFAGMTNFYKNRYVLEETVKHKIIAYLSVTTSDNFNFIIDMSLNDAYNISYDEVLNFAISQIKLRKSKYYAFLKHRQYTANADILEKYLHERKLDCIQTQCILVKDFYKQIKQPERNLQFFSFGEISSMN